MSEQVPFIRGTGDSSSAIRTMVRSRFRGALQGGHLQKLVFVLAAYFVAGRIGLSVPFTSGNVSPVWPPSGIALAAILIWGYRVWPGIALAAFLVNFLSPIPHPAALGIAVGNTSAALVAAFLLRRIANFQTIRRLRDVLGLVFLAGILSTMIAASVGVVSLFLAGVQPWSTYASAWGVWWLGDAMGVLLVAPLILTVRQLGRIRGTSRAIEGTVLLAGIALTCWFIFDNRFVTRTGEGVLAFSVFPFVVWAALRFGISGSAFASFLLATISVWATARGSGPFVRHTPMENAVLLQVFLAVIAITGMTLAVIVIERERAERALKREHQLLEAQRRSEEALRDSQQRLMGIISSTMDALITVDRDQRIVVFNKAAEQIFRCPASDAIGHPIDKFIPEQFREIHRQHIGNFGRTGVTGRSMYSPGTLLGRRANGEEFPIEAAISQIESGGEKLYTAIVRDVTVRNQTEEQLRQARKMEAVGQLAGGVAHEFNNFLGIIMGYSHLLDEQAAADETLSRSVADIKAATEHAASLTRQLLAFSRKQVLQPKVLDINQSVAEMDKLLRRLIGADIELVTVLQPGVGAVRADSAQIQQIFINLVVNARDAMPQGGSVVIETANVELDDHYAERNWDVHPGPYVMLAVTDTGLGMDAVTQAHIFEPFFTTKEQGKGTGLGLSMIHGIVKQSGGHIAVESAVGKGTTFRIYLPQVEERVRPDDGGPESAVEPRGGTETILIAEDEPALRELMSQCMRKLGYTVLTAQDGTEALEICEHHPGPIHLVLTDIVMPRMNGLQLKERVAAQRSGVKFLFVSGYVDAALERSELFTQDSAFLEKPFPPDELAHKVRQLLEGGVIGAPKQSATSLARP
jgi:PAS domain S-box-containing protein